MSALAVPFLLAFGGADQWFWIPLYCLRLDILLLRRSGRLAGLYYLRSVTGWSGR